MSGTALLRSALTERRCGGGRCAPHASPRGYLHCERCDGFWSASGTISVAMAAFAGVPCGIDVEDGSRSRPAAFRRASRWCTRPVSTIAEWTRAEAMWKAAYPRLATALPLPERVSDGWDLSLDGRWWLHTRQEPPGDVWTIAVARRP